MEKVTFSKITEHPLRSGTYMLHSPAVCLPPYFGSLGQCRKAQITFERKIKEEFEKLPCGRKKEILKTLNI